GWVCWCRPSAPSCASTTSWCSSSASACSRLWSTGFCWGLPCWWCFTDWRRCPPGNVEHQLDERSQPTPTKPSANTMDELVLVPPRRVPRRRSAGALHPLTSEAEVHLGPQRPSRLVDAGLGGEAEVAVASQVEVFGIGLVQQVIHPDTGSHFLAEAIGGVQ